MKDVIHRRFRVFCWKNLCSFIHHRCWLTICHPLSAIKSCTKPIEYSSKVSWRRSLFRCWRFLPIEDVCAIQMDWIVQLNPHLCQFGPIETEPEPRYDATDDRMVCHRKATLGRRVSWPLGQPMETPFPSNSVDRFRWFGKTFLDGIICPRLVQFRPALLCSSNAMVKSWAMLMERTQTFLNALASKQIDSRAQLTQIWSTEPKCKRREDDEFFFMNANASL